MTSYTALLTSLPTRNSTIRMRVWRLLKTTGCGVPRDGVYLLPAGTPRATALAEAEAEIRAAGGFAMTVELHVKAPVEIQHVRGLFDRSPSYAALLAQVQAAKSALKRLGRRKAETLVRRLRSALDEIVAIDFYPGAAQLQAQQALAALEQELQTLYAGGEPRASTRRPRRLDASRYRGRLWVTRNDLWVDRLACAWLIRRFIDRQARFAWLEHPRQRPKRAVGFDFDGAEFTHADSRVTFEVLATSFGLDGDPALAAIGHAVRFLDVGGIPVPDAKGLETILRGIKAKAVDDDAVAAQAAKVFDLVYAGYAPS